MKKKHSFLTKNIIIASDHAGFGLKELIKKKLENLGLNILDLGVDNKKISVDYPTYAKKLSKKINSKNMGILICGSGIGMSIASNRFKNVRSALVNSSTLSKLSRKHNNANIVCLAARFVSKKVAIQCILSFLTTKFEAGRHLRRVKLLS
jgi:ribose 5-phosphate isomerase B